MAVRGSKNKMDYVLIDKRAASRRNNQGALQSVQVHLSGKNIDKLEVLVPMPNQPPRRFRDAFSFFYVHAQIRETTFAVQIY